MDKNRFVTLTIHERAAFLWQYGEYISTIHDGGFRIRLYIINSLLVEVFYNEATNVIEYIDLIDICHERLNLYTADVNLADLNS